MLVLALRVSPDKPAGARFVSCGMTTHNHFAWCRVVAATPCGDGRACVVLEIGAPVVNYYLGHLGFAEDGSNKSYAMFPEMVIFFMMMNSIGHIESEREKWSLEKNASIPLRNGKPCNFGKLRLFSLILRLGNWKIAAARSWEKKSFRHKKKIWKVTFGTRFKLFIKHITNQWNQFKQKLLWEIFLIDSDPGMKTHAHQKPSRANQQIPHQSLINPQVKFHP